MREVLLEAGVEFHKNGINILWELYHEGEGSFGRQELGYTDRHWYFVPDDYVDEYPGKSFELPTEWRGKIIKKQYRGFINEAGSPVFYKDLEIRRMGKLMSDEMARFAFTWLVESEVLDTDQAA